MSRILLDDPAHAGGSSQLALGTRGVAGSGDGAFTGGGKLKQWAADLNAMTLDLYGGPNSSILPATGDTSTDTTALAVAIELLTASAIIQPGGSSYSMLGGIVWRPGVVSIASTFNLPSDKKYTGLSFRGALTCEGQAATTLYYTPESSQPMFANTHVLALSFKNLAFTSADVASGLINNQEQAGISSIQAPKFDNCTFNGWKYLSRLTGGNNNSENKFNDCTANGCGPWIYVPALTNCSISAGTSIAITNQGQGDVQVGDTGFFSASVAPMVSTTPATYYYVVDVTYTSGIATAFKVSATSGGSPITFTGSGTPTFQNASDQFLNHKFTGLNKHWSAIGSFLQMSYGGGIGFEYMDFSNYQPTSPSTLVVSCSGTTATIASVSAGRNAQPGDLWEGAFGSPILPGTMIVAILTGSGGAGSTVQLNLNQTIAASTPVFVPVYLFDMRTRIHSGGVEEFVGRYRVELANEVGRVGYFQWVSGDIEVRCDESSQATNRHATNLNWIFDMSNDCGPTITFRGQLAGKHGVVMGTNSFNFMNSMSYDRVTLLNQPDVANFMVASIASNNAATGGLPTAEFDGTVIRGTSTGTFKTVPDCTWNWSKGYGRIAKTRTANLTGANSNWPAAGNSLAIRLPLNCIITRVRLYKPAGGTAAAYSLTLQDTQGSPNVIQTYSGADSSVALNVDSGALWIPCTSDLIRQIQVVATGSTVSMPNVICAVEYIGG